jgi:hypothetical protein
MAGYWIKFDTSTPDKPEVWEIAQRLDIDPDAVVGKLLRVWSWFDDQTEKGNATIVTKALLDRRVGVTGFCDAMIDCGWMTESDSEIQVVNFDRHNGRTAKNRCLTAKRVAAHKAVTPKKRSGNDQGNATGVTTALPRSDTDQIQIVKPLPPKPHPSDEVTIPEGLEAAWSRWCRWRESQTGRTVDPIQAEAILMDLESRGVDKAARDIDFSIRKDARSILDSDNDFDKRRFLSKPPPETIPNWEDL